MKLPAHLTRRLETLEARFQNTGRDAEIEATIAEALPMLEQRAREWDTTVEALTADLRTELVRYHELGRERYWQEYSEQHAIPLDVCLDSERFAEHIDRAHAEYQAWRADVLSRQEWWQGGRHYIGGVPVV